MNIAYVLVQSTIGHEMEVLSELLKIQFVKEAKGTFGSVSYTHLTLPTIYSV